MATTAGYSGTPLVKKLGLKAEMRLAVLNEPADYRAWLGELPSGLVIHGRLSTPIAAVHCFEKKRANLERVLGELRTRLDPAGFVWVSWPRKSAKVLTDITEDVIREVALPMGFVDIKVCAVSDVWSGLKLVIRKSERGKPGAR